MHLTEYDLSLLEGAEGTGKQKAMEFIVRYAQVLNADELCDVSRATLFIGAQHYLDCYRHNERYSKIFSEFYLCSEEEAVIPKIAPICKAQTCAAACDFRGYAKTHLSEEYAAKNWSYLKATKSAGVKIVESCTPYYVGWIPLMGEHFVSTESSNVVISNSIFGAMGNSDGVEHAVCAAITGRTPKWGMHIKENRFADCIVNIKCKADDMFDWDVIGFTIGRLLPKHMIPVVCNIHKRPDINSFRQFASTLSVTSATEICHIVGLTPEAQTLAMAVGTKQILHEINITEEEYYKSIRMIGDGGSGPVDYVSIGCPHLSLDELKTIAEYIDGNKIKNGVELLIWTDYATKEMADVNGYTETIEKSGAYLLCGSCPVVMREKCHSHAKAMAMFGAKQAYSIRNQTNVPVYYGNIYQCIDSAISGEWKGMSKLL